jgi:tetratricopeptide (TPR) repeat protein
MLTAVFFLSLLGLAGADVPAEMARRQAAEHHKSGSALMRTERYEQAAEEFTKAIALDPFLVMAHYNLGQSYMALKRYVDAERAYRGAEEAVSRMGTLSDKARDEIDRRNRDEINELKSSLTQLRSGQIKNAPVEAMIPRIEERIRVLEDMRSSGREVVRVPAEIHLGLGSAYFRQDKLQDAEQAYSQAVKTNARLGAAHNNLAVIYMLTGRFAESRKAIAAAEKAGFAVNPRLKADLEAREAAARK